MTVSELINELQKIKNKNMKVYFDDEEWGEREVDKVILNNLNIKSILIKSYQ